MLDLGRKLDHVGTKFLAMTSYLPQGAYRHWRKCFP